MVSARATVVVEWQKTKVESSASKNARVVRSGRADTLLGGHASDSGGHCCSKGGKARRSVVLPEPMQYRGGERAKLSVML
jgi:hypothetical protein